MRKDRTIRPWDQTSWNKAKLVSTRLDKAEVWLMSLPDRCSLIYLHAEAAPIIAK